MTRPDDRSGDGLPADLRVSSLIHQMRQPLMGLNAGLGFLGSELSDSLDHRSDWQLINAQARRLEEIFAALPRPLPGKDEPVAILGPHLQGAAR